MVTAANKSSTTETKTRYMKKGKATQISEQLAERLQWIRTEMNLTQRVMAEKIGVSFQQYQKYEKGQDRISLERALVLCHSLGLSLTYLDVLDDTKSNPVAERKKASPFSSASNNLDVSQIKILKIFEKIPPEYHKGFIDTMQVISKTLIG